MATRCATIVHKDGRELCRHYRHYDGYPDGHGADLAMSLIKNRTFDMDTYLKDMEKFGAENESWQYVEHSDIEFLYEVDAGTGNIRMWDALGDCGYNHIMQDKEPEFNGSPYEFIAEFAPHLASQIANKDDAKESQGQKTDKTEHQYVLVDVERSDEDMACAVLGTYETQEAAHDAMVAAADKLRRQWPQGEITINKLDVSAFDIDRWDWTAWHKLLILDAADKDNRVWF